MKRTPYREGDPRQPRTRIDIPPRLDKNGEPYPNQLTSRLLPGGYFHPITWKHDPK